MSDDPKRVSPARVAVGAILVILLLSGPGSSIDFTDDSASLGDGNASVTVLEPGGEPLRVTDGRFGTNVSYVRIPDLVGHVTTVEGSPRVFYQVSVPAFGIEKQNSKVVQSPGRIRVPISDRALTGSVNTEGVTASVVVRVQSFTGGRVVLNRTVEVVSG